MAHLIYIQSGDISKHGHVNIEVKESLHVFVVLLLNKAQAMYYLATICLISKPTSEMGETCYHVDNIERCLVKQMAKEDVPWTTMQKVTGRSADTINATLHKEAIQHNDAHVRS